MADKWALLYDLIIILGAALLLGLVAEKLRQSVISGYLIAGVLVGPSAFGLVNDPEAISIVSELGVALLLYAIGLEFSWRRLKTLGNVGLLGGLLQIGLVIAVVALILMGLGLNTTAAVACGAIASLASTVVVLRMLESHAELDTIHGRASVGILLCQDLAIVPFVMLLTLLGDGQASAGHMPTGIVPMLLGTAGLAVGLYVIAGVLLPRVLSSRTVARNRELPILIALGACLSAAYVAHAVGLSPAIGAFIAGILLADTKFADQIRADITPLKTVFVTLFITSIGLVVDVQFLAENWAVVLGWLVVFTVLKSVLTAIACKPFLPSVVACMATGLTLSQAGEFSFVLAKVSRDGSLLSYQQYMTLVAVCALSLIISPGIVRHAAKWSRSLARRLVPLRVVARGERATVRAESGHVLLVGFGDAGREAADVIHSAGESLTILEISGVLVDTARGCGYTARLGDATQVLNLTKARLGDAKVLVVAIPDMRIARIIISQAKSLAPHVPIVVRSRYHHAASELDVVGGDVVVDEEQLVGRTIGARVLEITQPS